MTPNDWMYEIKDELIKVFEDNNIFVIGVKEELDDLELSINIGDNGDNYEAYVVSRPMNDTDLESAVESVKQVRDVIGQDEQNGEICTVDKGETWAENRFELSEERVRRL